MSSNTYNGSLGYPIRSVPEVVQDALSKEPSEFTQDDYDVVAGFIYEVLAFVNSAAAAWRDELVWRIQQREWAEKEARLRKGSLPVNLYLRKQLIAILRREYLGRLYDAFQFECRQVVSHRDEYPTLAHEPLWESAQRKESDR